MKTAISFLIALSLMAALALAESPPHPRPDTGPKGPATRPAEPMREKSDLFTARDLQHARQICNQFAIDHSKAKCKPKRSSMAAREWYCECE